MSNSARTRFSALALAALFTITHSIRALALPNPPAAAAATVVAPELASVRQQFRDAMAHATASDDGDSPELQRYPLYPYLQAERIRQALNGNPDTAATADRRAADFIDSYGTQPVANALRRSWLESLARREQWDSFTRNWRDAGASDPLRCLYLQARIAGGKSGSDLSADLTRQWLSTRAVPECDPVWNWATAQGVLTSDLLEKRVRLVLQAGNAGLARLLITRLPPARATAWSQWAALLETPRRGIDDLIEHPDIPVMPEALLAGWWRLARTEPAVAAERYTRLVQARNLDSGTASPYALAVAETLSWQRDPAALDWFVRVAAHDLDDNALEWRARAAMWAGNWTLVQQSLAALSATDRQNARWRYWNARASEQLGDAAQARRLYESVLADDNYYSGMAAARLKVPLAPHPQLVPDDVTLREKLEHRPVLVRTRELLLCGLRAEALAEWQYAGEEMTPEERPQALRLLADWGWYDQLVAVATGLKVFNDYALLYPQPYATAVNTASRITQLSPELIYGLMRQESLYRADAVSGAGAHGLLQLEPSTARLTARTLKHAPPSVADLSDPDINTELGAAHLRMLLDQLDGQLPLVLASYNAGLAAMRRWLPSSTVEPDIWVENIPYNETRAYVQRILWNTVVYGWLRSDGAQQHTGSWLNPVKPVAAQ